MLAPTIAYDISLDVTHREEPQSVIVFAAWDRGFVWIKHPTRGWEVPGGKVESGEVPEAAARREIWEEAGVILGELHWVAQYRIGSTADIQARHVKWVYAASVDDVQARPSFSEAADVRVFLPNITPEEAKRRPDLSFIMKDAMYATLFPVLLQHPFFMRNTT